jgi:hypothetical protein
VTVFVTAGAGFLLAVLWFDLMFDVQVLGHREPELPDDVLASIAGYYRRVTTEARPMTWLVAAVMVATIAAIVAQLARDEDPSWVTWASRGRAGVAVGLAALRTVPRAVRLGARGDTVEIQSTLARSICRDHLLCAAAIASLITIQLAAG